MLTLKQVDKDKKAIGKLNTVDVEYKQINIQTYLLKTGLETINSVLINLYSQRHVFNKLNEH